MVKSTSISNSLPAVRLCSPVVAVASVTTVFQSIAAASAISAFQGRTAFNAAKVFKSSIFGACLAAQTTAGATIFKALQGSLIGKIDAAIQNSPIQKILSAMPDIPSPEERGRQLEKALCDTSGGDHE